MHRMQHRKLHNLPHLLDLLLVSADLVVGHIRLLFHGHHGNCGIDLRRERDLNLVLRAVRADAHALFDIRRSHLLAQSNHELGDLINHRNSATGSGVLPGIWRW